MSLFLDVVVIAVFSFSFYSGIKRGFVRSIMGIVVLLLAIWGSAKFSPPLADYLNDKYIESAVSAKIGDSLDELISGVDSFNIRNLFEEKPQAFIDILEQFGINYEELKTYYEKDLRQEENSEDEVSHYIAQPLSRSISNATAFAVLFIGVVLILSLLVVLLDLVVKLPILNTANKILGAVFGCMMGLAFSWGLSIIFTNLLPHLAVIYEGTIPASVIENTVVVKLLGSLDPFTLF